MAQNKSDGSSSQNSLVERKELDEEQIKTIMLNLYKSFSIKGDTEGPEFSDEESVKSAPSVDPKE